jgi:hypothetical protein
MGQRRPGYGLPQQVEIFRFIAERQKRALVLIPRHSQNLAPSPPACELVGALPTGC